MNTIKKNMTLTSEEYDSRTNEGSVLTRPWHWDIATLFRDMLQYN